jgi:hypothetical protein
MRRVGLAVLCSIAVLAVAAPASAAPTLVGYWPLVEGSGQVAHDLSGNRNNGQLGSTAGVDANDPAWIRGGLRFSGNQWVSIPSSAALQPSTITVGALVRADHSPGQWGYIFSMGGFGCTAGSYGLYSGFGGGLAFYISDGSSFVVSPEAPPSVWDGRWHFVAGTFDGATVRVYVDGLEIGQGTRSSVPIGYAVGSQLPFVGAYRGGCDLTFGGDIGQVNVWNGALPVSTIWAKGLQALGRR